MDALDDLSKEMFPPIAMPCAFPGLMTFVPSLGMKLRGLFTKYQGSSE